MNSLPDIVPSFSFLRRLAPFILALGLLPAASTVSAADAPAAGESGKRFGYVLRIKGDVVAQGGGSTSERKLTEGDPVFVGDRVRAAPTAEAVLKTDDAGMIGVRPAAEFVAERFVAEGKPTDTSIMRIITGSLRVITGWIGHTNRVGHNVLTPTATIGIRGTDHEPYVLPLEQATATYKEGTYDKVNRGKTALVVGDNTLEIEAGKVGFARAVKKPVKERALLTILMPVLLEKVPDFYVAGQFDAELDQYSQTADEVSRTQLERKRKDGEAAKPAPVCSVAKLGKAWVDKLDRSIEKLDGPAIINAFAPDVVVLATVRTKDGGKATVELGREDLARSTLAAIKGLKGYKHRRISLEARPGDPEKPEACERIAIKSVVIEHGRQAGKPFRFESQEDYVIEQRDGQWLAVKAETTQR